ncbi:MAG TPA: PQQ-binding-like beta-propeller repeat protein, partial [bacterium]|nr:PQQ-binding-like beta-propeller repeat protein [bacterium]
YGQNFGDTRNQPCNDINPGNVGDLALQWSFHDPSAFTGGFIKGPAADQEALYLFDAFGGLYYKVDRKSGNLIWKRDINQSIRQCLPDVELPALLGLETAPALFGNKLIAGTVSSQFDFNPPTAPGGYVVTLNKNTGDCETATLVSDPNHLYEGVLSSPTIHGNVAYVPVSSYEEGAAGEPGYVCCNTVGKVCAINVQDGKKLWCEPLIDPRGDPSTSADDLPDLQGYSGVTSWTSAPAVYPEQNAVIITTGNAYTRGPVDPASLSPFHLALNSFVSFDMKTGRKNWVTQVIPDDFWNSGCLPFLGAPENCPEGQGPDYDFPSGASLIRGVTVGNAIRDVAAAINKSGKVFAVDVSTGELLWDSLIGPSSLISLGGNSSDGARFYAVSVNTVDIGVEGDISRAWVLQGGPHDGETIYGGSLSALDPGTGEILWQNAGDSSFVTDLFGFSVAPYLAPPSSAGTGNGVVFASATYPNELLAFFGGLDFELIYSLFPTAPNLFAFDAATGDILWSHATLNPPVAGPTIVGRSIYWATGLYLPGTLHAFEIPLP